MAAAAGLPSAADAELLATQALDRAGGLAVRDFLTDTTVSPDSVGCDAEDGVSST